MSEKLTIDIEVDPTDKAVVDFLTAKPEPVEITLIITDEGESAFINGMGLNS